MHQRRRALVAVVTAAALVIGLSWAGRRAREWLAGRGHYTVALAEVACAVPPGMARSDFLAEVQYLGNLPDKLALQRKARELESKRDEAWRAYDAAAKEIEVQKDGLLDQVEARLRQSVSDEELFAIRFEVK